MTDTQKNEAFDPEMIKNKRIFPLIIVIGAALAITWIMMSKTGSELETFKEKCSSAISAELPGAKLSGTPVWLHSDMEWNGMARTKGDQKRAFRCERGTFGDESVERFQLEGRIIHEQRKSLNP